MSAFTRAVTAGEWLLVRWGRGVSPVRVLEDVPEGGGFIRVSRGNRGPWTRSFVRNNSHYRARRSRVVCPIPLARSYREAREFADEYRAALQRVLAA